MTTSGELSNLKETIDQLEQELDNDKLTLLNNEKIIDETYPVTYLCPYNGTTTGSLAVTNFRLIFRSGNKGSIILEVPLGVISHLDKVGNLSSRGENAYGIEVFCKDLRNLRFAYKPENHSRRHFYEQLFKLAFPLTHDVPIWAYSFGEKYPTNGWQVYVPLREYQRMGIPDEAWRLTDINEKYELCDTYPTLLCVPKEASDDLIRSVAGYRSRARVPVLSWKHPLTDACIVRGAQPLAGVTGRRCKDDEKYLNAVREANSHSASTLCIMDARPTVNAIANKAKGGGYESEEHYRDVELTFLDIHNIHVMRESLRKLGEECFPYVDENRWLSKLESTQWLEHIRCVLVGALRVVDKIENNQTTVFVHCSDGWDRTAQLTALAMLMLDPYYRTIQGFEVLIEKEWLSFGHKFSQRTGQGKDASTDSERSPIFLQFIECVWQIMRQFPVAFEFTETLLIYILDHLYSCWYGTFLFNSDKERKDKGVASKTQSLWSSINCDMDEYLNPFYFPSDEEYVLYPVPSMRHLEFWNSYYLRWNPFTRCQEPIQARYKEVIVLQRDLEKRVAELRELLQSHNISPDFDDGQTDLGANSPEPTNVEN